MENGKVGGRASTDPTSHKAQPGASAVGKRTLVETITSHPAATKSTPPSATLQLKPDGPIAAAGGAGPAVTPPTGGINKSGFIDNSDGANIRTGPAEAGGQTVRNQPLPPATRVFVSGTHPHAPAWWYVTAYLDKTMVRGYVQDFRVTTDLPEPTAKLH
jgi:hypothetical protein